MRSLVTGLRFLPHKGALLSSTPLLNLSFSMSSSSTRKGASRVADIPPQVLQRLSSGDESSVTLVEILAIDQLQLARSVFPAASPATFELIKACCELGVLKRMGGIGAALLQAFGEAALGDCQAHKSDTVRGWACFMMAAQSDLMLTQRLEALKPLADDPHFGVREWAWLAMRPHLAKDLSASIDLLQPWTAEPSENLRRFACESLRPRGVWCAHIRELKEHPERALPILEPLRADPSVYVQDSVANWLNDASKHQPAWVQGLCTQWAEQSPAESTRRIVQRALRSL